uniref:CEBP_ZZ domain-containing protein n=1 Tax=Ascaris lumbricoides TaxID=6252 RepID=A0A0M3HRB6_ASCLU
MKALKVDVSDIEAQVGAKEEKWMYCLRHEICLISVMLHSIFSRFGVVYVCIPGRRQGPIHVRRNSTDILSRGFAFLVFELERSVHSLVDSCQKNGEGLFFPISTPSVRNKLVQVRPWKLEDARFAPLPHAPVAPRRMVLVEGVPIPTTAGDLAIILGARYGPICLVEIQVHPCLLYPMGCARVVFNTNEGYIRAVKDVFVDLPHRNTVKRVEMRPFLMDAQICDECYGTKSSGEYASYFCGVTSCLQYFCKNCWDEHRNAHINDNRFWQRSGNGETQV